MPIQFRCPLGHRLGAPDHYAGKKIRCPVCREKVRIPRAGEPPPASPSEAQSAPAGEQSAAGVATPATAGSQASAVEPAEQPPAPESQEHQRQAASLPGAPGGEASSDAATPPESAPSAESIWREIVVLSDQDDPAWWTLYQPDPGKVQSARLLALAMAATCVVGAVPGAIYLARGELPAWTVVVLGVAALQLLYLVWMASLPDWSTVWVGMLVFAASGAFYGAVSAWLLFAPPGKPLAFDLETIRRQALGWSVANLTLCTLVTYAAGRLAGSWRLADLVRYQNEAEKHSSPAV